MKKPTSEPWYRKYAWLLFALVGLSGLIPGIRTKNITNRSRQ
jgi:hypothetical protein